jgi:hypothetical protein
MTDIELVGQAVEQCGLPHNIAAFHRIKTKLSEVQKPSDNKQSKICLGCRRHQSGSTDCLTCSRISPVIIDKWEA